MRNVMGDKTFNRVNVSNMNPHNPKAPPRPRKPGEQKEAKPRHPDLIEPLFPLIPDDKVQEYITKNWEEKSANDVIGNYQRGKIDPELNNLALQAVAEERGITVEQLLAQTPDKKLEEKLEFADMNEQAPARPGAVKEMSIEEARRIMHAENERLKAQHQERQEQPAPQPGLNGAEQSFERPVQAPRPQKKKLQPKKVHTLLKDLRREFALESIEPLIVTLRNHSFKLAPPAASLHPWILAKIANASYLNSQQAVEVAIMHTIVAAALYEIDDVSVADIFGLIETDAPPVTQMNPELRELMAQSLWEMFADVTSIEGGFTFDPQLIVRLYKDYTQKFKDDRFEPKDPSLHRFICPVEGCEEFLNMKPKSDGYFCKMHGVKLDDAGSLAEVEQLPLL